MTSTDTYDIHDLVVPEKLTWKKSEYGGYTADRGDLMFWSRSKHSTAFAEDSVCRVGFKAARKREGKGWELRIWTDKLTETTAVIDFETLAQCKEAAPLFAAALAWRFDGTFPGDFWVARSIIRDVQGPVELWVTYPEQREEHDVKRLAGCHVAVTL